MKKFLTAVAMALLFVGCAKEAVDLSGINEKLAELDNRVSALEGSIASIQSAIGDGVFVQKVEQYADPETGKTIGVTVTYTSGKVVYFEISPKADYSGPVLGVIRSGSGALVWSVDGIAIKDADGEEVPVNKTPVFTIDEEGYLWVSIDGGDPVKLGPVKSEGASLVDGIFKDIKVEQDKVVLVLSDDSIVNIPFAVAFKLNIEQKEYVLENNNTITIPYTVSGKTENTVVGVAGYDPYYFYVVVTEENIQITPLSSDSEAVFLIYADSQVGLTSMVSVSVSQESARVIDPEDPDYDADYVVEGDGGTVEMHVVSNVEIEARVPEEDSWISILSTKSTVYTITAKIEENPGAAREGRVRIYKKGTDKRLQTIYIYQAEAGEKPTGPVNLSAKGVANSYIVTKAGEYTFAAVKGNSLESVGTVAKAEIVWETENTATAPEVGSIIASVSYANNYITFSTPETLKPGNALIAAKDAEGKILWSWHIWIPNTAITEDTYGLGEVKMMSRALGALVDADGTASAKPDITSVGLMYQWGRKDPFMNAGSFFSSTGAHGAATAPADVFKTSATAGATIAYSIENPTEYIKGADDSSTWCSETTDANWAAAKTIYDPCPPGYRVPQSTEVLLLNKAKADIPGWDSSYKDYNWFVCGNPTTQFANAGFIEETGLDHYRSVERVIIWSSTVYTDSKRARCALYNGGSVSADTKQAQARAGIVRCVVDDATPVIPEPPVPVATVTDLSKDASANCYIITEAGDYKFKAVQGNSTTTVGTIAKAEIVWETNNTATAPEANGIIAKVGVDEGYITFSTPATLVPGNALIAAKDESDNILWSWHIWIPADAIVVWDSEEFAGAKMLDRNVGALKATNKEGDVDILSIGLYYQWGRKDPFPGATAFVNEAAGAAVAGTAWTHKKELITTEYSIQHPTEYASVPEVDAGVWNVDDPKDLWLTSDKKKTIYDPCPPGYRVPNYDNTKPMWTKSDTGWTFETNRFSYGDYYFTIAGYIDCWGAAYAYANLRTHIWTNEWKEETKAYCLYERADKSSKYYDYAFHKAKAGSVRCVAE